MIIFIEKKEEKHKKKLPSKPIKEVTSKSVSIDLDQSKNQNRVGHLKKIEKRFDIE
jgi:hypothetical protein